MEENSELEMDNAVWTPTEVGTQAQGMDLVRERVDEYLVELEPGMKVYPARNFNQSYGSVKSLIGGISSSTYRDNAKRMSQFQQQPVKTKLATRLSHIRSWVRHQPVLKLDCVHQGSLAESSGLGRNVESSWT
ncbi:hypothetical protein L6452_22911 [Arctium lappa]|uniref:Uncharacterized protein n=1 Tax=Arctium lappa TaxID=4217 RepID=A0ACB9B1Q6_ARCLA|nr:hypothetical protein L6452_22911 [Arctium lappa]